MRGRSFAMRAFASFALCLMLVFSWCAGTARAADGDSDSDSSSFSMGVLTDRYATLDGLANSLNTNSDVVIGARIGTLASVNRALDGSKVRFSGEVIDQAVAADSGHKWLSIADGADSSISVYVTDEMADKIANYGSYQSTGDTVEVTGVYSVACSEHQGELDVHAESLDVTESGGAQAHKVNTQRLVIGIVLCVVALALAAAFFYSRRIRKARGKRA